MLQESFKNDRLFTEWYLEVALHLQVLWRWVDRTSLVQMETPVQGHDALVMPKNRSRVTWFPGQSSHLLPLSRCCSCLTLCDCVDWSRPGFPVLHCLLEFAQIHIHSVGDAIQSSHPLPPRSLVLSLSQHQSLFQWIGSSYQVDKELELQLQHQSFQQIFRVDIL